MRTEDIDWSSKTLLYVITIDSFVKFGITKNWNKRKKTYFKDFEGANINFIKKYEFSNRWSAELIEQVIKWRMKAWIVYGRHEYTKLPVLKVLTCISETISELEHEYYKHEYIHKRGRERWDFYKHIAQYYFPEFDPNKISDKIKSEISNEIEITQLSDLFFPNKEKSKIQNKLRFRTNSKINNADDLCIECLGKLEKKIPKRTKFKKNQTYYFEYYFFCSRCNLMYMVEEAKREIT